MCAERQRGTTSDTIANLRQPMPMRRKLRLIGRNTWKKIRTRSDCCGNHGEPGC